MEKVMIVDDDEGIRCLHEQVLTDEGYQVILACGCLEAVEILFRYGYSFWDSLIIEAAIKSGAGALLSEDLSHGQIINDVTIKNPFKTEPFPL